MNSIAVENRRQATGGFQRLFQPSSLRSVEGYTTQISYDVTEQVEFCVRSKTDFTITIYRLGYYGGGGWRKVWEQRVSVKNRQPSAELDPVTGLVRCYWDICAAWTPSDVCSGLFVAEFKPIRGYDGDCSWTFFILRDDSRLAQILVQASDTTWQAYNSWADSHGQFGLYSANSNSDLRWSLSSRFYAAVNGYISGDGKLPGDYCGPVDHAGDRGALGVSYDRPFDALPNCIDAEIMLISWIERNGYDVKYCAASDFARHQKLLEEGKLDPKLVVSSGHDEYWSFSQRNVIEKARDRGINLAFLSGNTCWMRISWGWGDDGGDSWFDDTSRSASPYRSFICFKQPLQAPSQASWSSAVLSQTFKLPVPSSGVSPQLKEKLKGMWTGTWCNSANQSASPPGQPESELTGLVWKVRAFERMSPRSIQVPERMKGDNLWWGTGLDKKPTSAFPYSLGPGTLEYEWDFVSKIDPKPTVSKINFATETLVEVPPYVVDQEVDGNVVPDDPDKRGFPLLQTSGPVTHNVIWFISTAGTDKSLVFSVGAVYWSAGLAPIQSREIDALPRIRVQQQAMVNVFAAMGCVADTLQGDLLMPPKNFSLG